MQNKQVDYKLFFAVFALIIFWMIMISSVSVYWSFRVTSLLQSRWVIDEAYNHFYLLRNITHVWISMLILLFFVKIPYSFFEKNAKYIFWWNLIFLLMVLLFWSNFWGSSRWLIIPWVPFSIQPSEFLVFSLVIFLSYFFKKNYNKLESFKKWFLPFLGIIWIVFVLVWLQPNFWTIMIVWPLSVFMFLIAWARVRYLVWLFMIWVIFILSIYNIWSYDKSDLSTRNKLSYATDRIDNFLASKKDLIESRQVNYQLEQWFIAIWSGWFTWLWFGWSVQKFWYLPEVQWDMIFSVIIEELGFIWGLVLLSMFAYIGYRWFYISYFSADLFAKFAAFWITSRILLQSFINIWVNLWIVPLTWITLPFISYWWSSLISLTLWIWLLLNISRYVDESKWWRFYWKNKTFSKQRVNIY